MGSEMCIRDSLCSICGCHISDFSSILSHMEISSEHDGTGTLGAANCIFTMIHHRPSPTGRSQRPKRAGPKGVNSQQFQTSFIFFFASMVNGRTTHNYVEKEKKWPSKSSQNKFPNAPIRVGLRRRKSNVILSPTRAAF